MSFYTYYQNNSGGSFDVDHRVGISQYVIIEADNASEADDRAVNLGLYFDGAWDCHCSGDRWGSAYDPHDATEEPEIYGESATAWSKFRGGWVTGPDTYIHYADGRITSVSYSREGAATSVYYDSAADLAKAFEEEK